MEDSSGFCDVHPEKLKAKAMRTPPMQEYFKIRLNIQKLALENEDNIIALDE